MSTVSDIIDDIRIELHDSQGDWEDADLVTIISKSVRRMNRLLQKHGIKDGKSYKSFNTTSGTYQYEFSGDLSITDFGTPDGLYREDWDESLTLRSDDDWERIYSATEATSYRINGDYLEITGTPTQTIEMHFYYWPLIDTSSYSTATTMPWSGKFDDVISEYSSLRCKNIDEMDWDADSQILEDMLKTTINFFQAKDPGTTEVEPWLSPHYDY
jgi:hypothetical protein